jgi:hypothetical protein
MLGFTHVLGLFADRKGKTARPKSPYLEKTSLLGVMTVPTIINIESPGKPITNSEASMARCG